MSIKFTQGTKLDVFKADTKLTNSLPELNIFSDQLKAVSNTNVGEDSESQAAQTMVKESETVEKQGEKYAARFMRRRNDEKPGLSGTKGADGSSHPLFNKKTGDPVASYNSNAPKLTVVGDNGEIVAQETTQAASQAASNAARQTASTAKKSSQDAVKESAKAAASKAASSAGSAAAKTGASAAGGTAGLWIAAGAFALIVLIVLVMLLSMYNETSQYNVIGDKLTELNGEFNEAAQRSLDELIAQNTSEGETVDVVLQEEDAELFGEGTFYATNLEAVGAIWYAKNLSENNGTLNTDETALAKMDDIFWQMNGISFSLVSCEKAEEGTLLTIAVDRISLTLEDGQELFSLTEEEKNTAADFIEGKMISVYTQSGANIQVNLSMPSSPQKGSEIVSNAKKYLGRSYASMDCSALVRAAYNDSGISWSGTSDAMAKKCAEMNCMITKEQLQLGDLVFWQSIDPNIGKPFCGNSRCSGTCTRWNMVHHVAIYIGNGQIIESATGGVQIRNLWTTAKWKQLCYARPYVVG